MMNFTEFSTKVSKIKNLPLPGISSHHKLSPEFRVKELKRAISAGKKPKKAGVMALFYPDPSATTHLLLILRKTYEGVHSNQIGFPGGKEEPGDTDLLETALRETQEEVGVPPTEVAVIRALTEVYIPPSNFEVTPYVGLYADAQPFVIQETEVASLVQVPLSDILNDDLMITQRLSTSYAKNVEVPAFKLNGYTVWGATAMMLSELRELLKQVL